MLHSWSVTEVCPKILLMLRKHDFGYITMLVFFFQIDNCVLVLLFVCFSWAIIAWYEWQIWWQPLCEQVSCCVNMYFHRILHFYYCLIIVVQMRWFKKNYHCIVPMTTSKHFLGIVFTGVSWSILDAPMHITRVRSSCEACVSVSPMSLLQQWSILKVLLL